MSLLEGLPPELLDIIVAFCPLSSIKNLRLSSRILRDVANDYLLRPEVVAFFNRESMENIKAIARHRQIARTVRAVWFQADRLEDYSTYDEWNSRRREQGAHLRRYLPDGFEDLVPLTTEQWGEDRLWDARASEIRRLWADFEREDSPDTVDKPKIPEAELRECYEHYVRLVEDQDRLVEGEHSTMRECYAALFRGCPNLVTVEVSMAGLLRPMTIRKNAIFQKGLVFPRGDPASDIQGLDAVTGLIQAAYDADFSPKELRLASVTHYLTTEEDLVEEAAAFLRNVEVLHWQLATPYLNDVFEVDPDEYEAIIEDLEGGNLATFLADAPNLRILELEMPSCESDWSCPRLAAVVGSNFWPHLSSFIITKIGTSPEDLSRFLLCHTSLRLLGLRQVRLTSGDWPSCFKLFAGKLPELQQVELRGLFENPHSSFYWFGHLESLRGNKFERKIAQYLIEGGAECPAVPEEADGTEDEWESDASVQGEEQHSEEQVNEAVTSASG